MKLGTPRFPATNDRLFMFDAIIEHGYPVVVTNVIENEGVFVVSGADNSGNFISINRISLSDWRGEGNDRTSLYVFNSEDEFESTWKPGSDKKNILTSQPIQYK